MAAQGLPLRPLRQQPSMRTTNTKILVAAGGKCLAGKAATPACLAPGLRRRPLRWCRPMLWAYLGEQLS